MEKKYLRENFKEFKNCRTEREFIETADKLNNSRDYYYRMSDGTGTFNASDVLDSIEDKGDWGELKGFIRIELHNSYDNNSYDNIEKLEIPINICFEEWDDEEKIFNYESYLISDVDEW